MIIVRALIVLLAFLFVPNICAAAEKAFIRDIQADPAKYLNIPVQLRGEVVQVTAEGQPTRGTYTLRDDSDRTIAVRSKDLPAPGRTVIVEGVLSQDPGVTVYYLREMNRCEQGFFNFCGGVDWWMAGVVAAAIVVAALIVVLLVLLLKPAPQRAGTTATPIAMPQEKTRPVTTEELRKLTTPAQSTVRLPVVPAQVEVLSGTKTGSRVILKQETSIGRSNGDLPLDDPTVSTEHAKIVFENQGYRLINRSLTNPTRVNGTPIEGGVDLKDGDDILMGSVKLRFNLLR